MDKNKEISNRQRCDKYINRYLLRARNIVDYTCYQYGEYNYMVSGEPDAHFISDFQYFVFTKSTKSLESIRTLLKIGHIEDVFILLRTMFEGYDFLAKILTLFVFTKIFESM